MSSCHESDTGREHLHTAARHHMVHMVHAERTLPSHHSRPSPPPAQLTPYKREKDLFAKKQLPLVGAALLLGRGVVVHPGH